MMILGIMTRAVQLMTPARCDGRATLKLREMRQSDVRYASACRSLAQHSSLKEMRVTRSANSVSLPVACWPRPRQAEAYRTFGGRISLSFSVGRDHDKLKHIGHRIDAFL